MRLCCSNLIPDPPGKVSCTEAANLFRLSAVSLRAFCSHSLCAARPGHGQTLTGPCSSQGFRGLVAFCEQLFLGEGG